jgi:hypothetical protein
MTDTNDKNDKPARKPRNTRAQQIAVLEAKLAEMKAKEAGTFVDDSVLKRLEKRLRVTNRELKAAKTALYGVQKKDGKGWVTAPIDEKIANLKKRLASHEETQKRATEFEAKLPFDIERLEAAIAVAKTDQDVDFPDDLTPLQRPEKRTDEQHEANAVLAQDEENN